MFKIGLYESNGKNKTAFLYDHRKGFELLSDRKGSSHWRHSENLYDFKNYLGHSVPEKEFDSFIIEINDFFYYNFSSKENILYVVDKSKIFKVSQNLLINETEIIKIKNISKILILSENYIEIFIDGHSFNIVVDDYQKLKNNLIGESYV